jgi:hypothetical protein
VIRADGVCTVELSQSLVLGVAKLSREVQRLRTDNGTPKPHIRLPVLCLLHEGRPLILPQYRAYVVVRAVADNASAATVVGSAGSLLPE